MPEIMAKKKRKLHTTNNDEQQKNVKCTDLGSMPNFLPVFPDGELEETMQDHSEGLR